jgi:protein-S-isoprenylcysteine O-methyltransferase Ste14
MILSWVFFYALHTFLASGKLKRFLEAKWPMQMKWYRLFYSLFSLILFLGILIQALFLPAQTLFTQNPNLTYVGYILATMGMVLISRSLKAISFSSFLGLSVTKEELGQPLIINGIYSWLRHPLYFGLMLVFLGYFLVAGTLGAGIHLGCLLIYLPIGIYFEEQNLVGKYGKAYQEYQKTVPALFPIKLKKGL